MGKLQKENISSLCANEQRKRSYEANSAPMWRVKEVLLEWTVRYKDRQVTTEELDVLAIAYHGDLKRKMITHGRFNDAVQIVHDTCRFFPTMADILKADEKRQDMNETNSMIEHLDYKDGWKRWDRSQIETEHGRKQFANIFKILAGEITTEEGVARSRQLVKEYKAKRR